MQLNALAETKDWDGLEAFSRERKPAPVTGYEPFIGACKNNSAPNERTARQVLCLPSPMYVCAMSSPILLAFSMMNARIL